MLTDGLKWCGLLVEYCDVFISCLDFHSDGTHSLQRIHWWARDVMLHFYKSVMLKKQTHLHLGWPEGEYICSKFSFLGKPFLRITWNLCWMHCGKQYSTKCIWSSGNYIHIALLHSLPAFGKSDHAAIFLTPEYKQRLAQEPPVKREVTRWSSHSEAMLQSALDDVDWDMFRASSSDVSEFTEVAVSFVNTLTEQATETITVRTFPNQKPWVDRSIRDAVNKRTAAYNEALLSGNMREYKASCYALRRAVSAAKHRYKERIESHFQLNDSRRMWQGLRTICAFGNKSSAEVRADPSLAEELNTFYGRFESNGGIAALPSSNVRKQQAEKRESCDHRDGGRGSEGTKGSEHQESGWTWRDHRPGSEIMRWSACWFVHFYLNESLATSVVPTSFKKSIIIPCLRTVNPLPEWLSSSGPHIYSHEGFWETC